jgi:hypothetical protein
VTLEALAALLPVLLIATYVLDVRSARSRKRRGGLIRGIGGRFWLEDPSALRVLHDPEEM